MHACYSNACLVTTRNWDGEPLTRIEKLTFIHGLWGWGEEDIFEDDIPNDSSLFWSGVYKYKNAVGSILTDFVKLSNAEICVTEVLCQRVKGSLLQALHLDISGLGIGAVEGLESCLSLQSLDLSRNCLEEFENFECCKHIWRLNLSDNKLKCLNSLSKIQALGTLDLSYNELSWNDLIHIRHVHIMDLRLHGNEKLESDIYYRLHVVDCLPLVWMLDGRLITSAERIQVQQFFYDSALSNRPVRHKINEKSYLCTKAAKSVEIYGDRTFHLTSNFPVNEPHNSDTDRRRLEFLAHNIQEDLKNRGHSMKRPCNFISQNALQVIIKHRCDDKEKCNMLLLLLISSLEFNLPESLIEQTLEVTKLNPLFDMDTLQLFQLDATSRTEVISVLVSSCKLDRDLTKPTSGYFTSGGLYDRLYLCLYHSVERLVKKTCKLKRSNAITKNVWNEFEKSRRNYTLVRPHTAPPRDRPDINRTSTRKVTSEWKAHKGLLASELVLLLSVVPSFYHHISEKNESVCNVLSLATGDHDLYLRLSDLAHDLTMHGGDVNNLYKEICRSVINRIELATINTLATQDAVTNTDNDFNPLRSVGRISSNSKEARFILGASCAYPRRPKSAALTSGERLIAKKRYGNPTSYIHMIKPYDLEHLTLGSLVLLGPQNLAKVIALPEQYIALVQMDLITGANGSVSVQAKNVEEHFCYVDVRKLSYDHQAGYWKPRGAVGDKVTLQAEDPTLPRSLISAPGQSEIGRLLSSSKMERYSPREKERPKSNRILSSPSITTYPTSSSVVPTFDDAEKPGNSVDEAIEDKPSLLRPLSALFCKKMDLSLAESAQQYSGLPRASYRYNASDESAGREVGRNDTFLTEMSNHLPTRSEYSDDDMIKGVADMNYKANYQPEMGQYIDGEEWNSSPSNENPVDTYLKNRIQEEAHFSDVSSSVDDYSGKATPEPEEKLPMKSPVTLAEETQEEDSTSRPSVSIPLPSGVSAESARFLEDHEEFEDELPSPDNSLAEGEGFRTGEDRDSFGKGEKLDTISLERYIDESDDKNKSNVNLSLSGSQMSFHQQPTKDRRQRSQSAKVPKHTFRVQNQGSHRPVSAVLPHQKRVMFHDEDHVRDDSRPGSASSFQLRRTEAWRSSTSSGGFVDPMQGSVSSPFSHFVVDQTALRRNSKVKFSMGVRRPPPQRPTSPDQASPPTSSANTNIQSNQLPVSSSQMSVKLDNFRSEPSKVLTGSWLAEGRNLHKEDFHNRRLVTSPRVPGYLEGLSLQQTKHHLLHKSTPNTDVAVHSLPLRISKPFSTFPHNSYRRSYDSSRSPSPVSFMTGSPAWHRPRFSSLNEVKKLSSKPLRHLGRTRFSRK